MVIDWVKESEGVEICKSTASLWLHDLGFTYEQFSKGVYFDGHERDDVVESRKVYLDTLDSLRHRMWVSHSPRPDPLCRPVIRIFHDESTYYANADQSHHTLHTSSPYCVSHKRLFPTIFPIHVRSNVLLEADMLL